MICRSQVNTEEASLRQFLTRFSWLSHHVSWLWLQVRLWLLIDRCSDICGRSHEDGKLAVCHILHAKIRPVVTRQRFESVQRLVEKTEAYASVFAMPSVDVSPVFKSEFRGYFFP